MLSGRIEDTSRHEIPSGPVAVGNSQLLASLLRASDGSCLVPRVTKSFRGHSGQANLEGLMRPAQVSAEVRQNIPGHK